MGKRVKFTVYADSQSDLDRIRKLYANDTRVLMHCQGCGIPVSKVLKKIIGRDFNDLYCRSCGIKVATFNKYGVINVFQLESTKETMKKTCLEKYGVEYVSQDSAFRKKVENIIKERYGVSNITQVEMFKQKAKKTRYEKYDGKYRSDETTNKIKETCLKRYGYEVPCTSPENLEKSKESMKEKYGSEYFFHTAAYKQRMTELYGGENPDYCPSILSKMKRKYTFENLHFDSTWEIAYYIWLKDNCKNFTVHPKEYFSYTFDSKKHRYHPDFLVDGKYVEIKGPHLLNEMMKENTISNAKYKCMIENDVKVISDLSPYFIFLKNKYNIRPADLHQYKNCQ